MKIKTKVNGRTAYYVATTNGRPIAGAAALAADFPQPVAEKVLAQLQAIDHRFAEAELVP